MNSTFTKALTEDQKSEYEKHFKSSYLYRKMLTTAIDHKKNEITKSLLSKSNYDKKCWSEFQADGIGYLRALDDIKSWIEK